MTFKFSNILSVTDKSPCIIGCQKCGQTSVVDWLKQYYHKVTKNEYIHQSWGLEAWSKLDSKYFPIIIIRDRPSAIWSRYFYFSFNDKYTLSEFLHHSYTSINPLFNTDYSSLIEPWLKYNPYILNLEELKTTQGFPHSNKSHKPTYRKWTNDELAQIKEAIDTYNPALLTVR